MIITIAYLWFTDIKSNLLGVAYASFEKGKILIISN